MGTIGTTGTVATGTKKRGVLRLGLAVVVAAAVVGAAGATASPDPRVLALRLVDVPAGADFLRGTYSSLATEAQQTNRSEEALRLRGFVSRYDVLYSLGSTQTKVVGVSLVVYRGPRGPVDDFADGLTLCHSNIGHDVPFAVSIGQQSHACTIRQFRGYTTTMVFWRHGNVSATVGVTSTSHADLLPLVTSLAQKQDARLPS